MKQTPIDKEAVKAFLLELQSKICAALEACDGKKFSQDDWNRAEGGGGITRIQIMGRFSSVLG